MAENTENTCEVCDDTGCCPTCEGRGTMPSPRNDSRMPCASCFGTGRCPVCGEDCPTEADYSRTRVSK